jgi:hypothetical protein
MNLKVPVMISLISQITTSEGRCYAIKLLNTIQKTNIMSDSTIKYYTTCKKPENVYFSNATASLRRWTNLN